MKKLLALLIGLAFVIGINIPHVHAASATANVTLSYGVPVTIEEVKPMQIKFVRNPAVSPTTSISNQRIHTASSSTYSTYFSSVNVVQGCFKVTANPSANVKVTIGNPTTSKGSISSSGRYCFAISNSACPGSNVGSYFVSLPYTVTMPSSGINYIGYNFCNDVNSIPSGDQVFLLSLPDLQAGNISVTIPVTVDY